MFKLVTPDTVTIPVRIHPPGGPEGEIRIRTRYRGVQDRIDHLESVQQEHRGDLDFVRDNLVGWEGICDESGAPIEYSDERARDLVLDLPYVFFPVRDAILDELGHRRALSKN